MEARSPTNNTRVLIQIHVLLERFFSKVGRNDCTRDILTRCHQLATNDSRSEEGVIALCAEIESYLIDLRENVVHVRGDVDDALTNFRSFKGSLVMKGEEKKTESDLLVLRRMKMRSRAYSLDESSDVVRPEEKEPPRVNSEIKTKTKAKAKAKAKRRPRAYSEDFPAPKYKGVIPSPSTKNRNSYLFSFPDTKNTSKRPSSSRAPSKR